MFTSLFGNALETKGQFAAADKPFAAAEEPFAAAEERFAAVEEPFAAAEAPLGSGRLFSLLVNVGSGRLCVSVLL